MSKDIYWLRYTRQFFYLLQFYERSELVLPVDRFSQTEPVTKVPSSWYFLWVCPSLDLGSRCFVYTLLHGLWPFPTCVDIACATRCLVPSTTVFRSICVFEPQQIALHQPTPSGVSLSVFRVWLRFRQFFHSGIIIRPANLVCCYLSSLRMPKFVKPSWRILLLPTRRLMMPL